MIAMSEIQSMAVRDPAHFRGTVTKDNLFKTGGGKSILVCDGGAQVWVRCFGSVWPTYDKGQFVEICGQVKSSLNTEKEIGVDAKNAAHRIEKVEREGKTHLKDVLELAVGSYVTVECEITDPDHDGWTCVNGNQKKRLVVKQDVVEGDKKYAVTLYVHVLNVGDRKFVNDATIRVENAEVVKNKTSGAIELLVYGPHKITVLSTRQGVLDPALYAPK